MKQSEQILPAKVRTILYRHAQVLSHHQTTDIKYRLTATDSEPFSLWNTVIWAQHSAQISFVKATRLDIMFQLKWTEQVQLLDWERIHFYVSFWLDGSLKVHYVTFSELGPEHESVRNLLFLLTLFFPCGIAFFKGLPCMKTPENWYTHQKLQKLQFDYCD